MANHLWTAEYYFYGFTFFFGKAYCRLAEK